MAVTVGATNVQFLNQMATNTDDDYYGAIATVGQTSTDFHVGDTGNGTPTSVIYKSSGTGEGYAGKGAGTALNYNVSSRHLFFWVKFLDVVADAPAGYRCRITDNTLVDNTNYWGWDLGGKDNRRAGINGFVRLVIDTDITPDYDVGTDPTVASVDSIGVGGNFATNSGQNTNFVDNIMTMTGPIQLYGGTAIARGNSLQFSAADLTGGYGVFKAIDGVYFVLSGIEFGITTASTDSYFQDSGETWLFEDQNVAIDWYEMSFVGGTGTNDVEFGELVGTGITATGVGGNTFIANGQPFLITCSNSSIAVKFYGCNFLNSTTAGGTVALEQVNADAISCLFSQCDEITVRNGALLRKCIITDSTASTTEGALNLGGADPAANSVRDLQIQNCSKGIKLVGTGNVTYNFRNIKFANNTNDVRVDFGVGDTVTINILEDGDTPTIDNVNGSTVNIVNAKTVKITALDASTLLPVQNARVLLEADTGGDLPVGESVTITRSVSTATVTHTAHGLTTGQKATIRGAAEQEYNGVYVVTVTTANAYTYTVSGTPATPATGTITSTGVLVAGLTDASGIVQNTGWPYTTDQPVAGTARRSSTSPLYKRSPLTGDVTTDGYDQNTFLVSDE